MNPNRAIARGPWAALLGAIALLASAPAPSGASDPEPTATSAERTTSARPEVHVYKTPTCGCCGKWVKHLRDHGFEVRTTDLPRLEMVKHSNGVPRELSSCHTAIVGNYVVEGHVPATDILRMLDEKPAISGLAVPRMRWALRGWRDRTRSDTACSPSTPMRTSPRTRPTGRDPVSRRPRR